MSNYFLVHELDPDNPEGPSRLLHIVEEGSSQFLCGLHFVVERPKPEPGCYVGVFTQTLGDTLPTATYCTSCHIEWTKRQFVYVHRN